MPYNKRFPAVWFKEKSNQLLEDARTLLPIKPGSLKNFDYEYKRHGTCKIIVAVEPKASRHHIAFTDMRAKKDFSHFMKDQIMDRYSYAQRIYVVHDNLNTHIAKFS